MESPLLEMDVLGYLYELENREEDLKWKEGEEELQPQPSGQDEEPRSGAVETYTVAKFPNKIEEESKEFIFTTYTQQFQLKSSGCGLGRQ